MEPPATELRADSCIPHGSDHFENSLASDLVVKTGVSIDVKEEEEVGARPPVEEDRARKRKVGEQEAGRAGKAGRCQVSEAGGETHQEESLWTWRSSSSSPSKLEELLEESKDRVGALEAETEQLKAENAEIKETKKELEAETEQLKAELKEEKAKQINQKSEMEKTTKLMAELQEKVECPVCLMVPREGPVPCCPVGHIICSPCLEKLRTEGRGECPTCRLPMGEGKSALAKHIIENMDHQCSHQGCDEMVAFGNKAHQASCEYRLVICPGFRQVCKAMVPFCNVKDHAKACKEVFEKKQLKQGLNFGFPEAMVDVLPLMDWNAHMFSADNGDTFFFRLSRSNKLFSLEVVMLGTQEACEAYTMEVAVMNPDTRKVAFRGHFKPRPIVATNITDEFCLTIKQESLAKIWRFNKEGKMFEFVVSAQIKI